LYNRILVPVDGSELAECVLPHVASIAGGCGVKTVVFIRVVEPSNLESGYGSSTLSVEKINRINEENITTAENYLKRLVERSQYSGVDVKSEVIRGRAAESIVDYAEHNAIDLIIIATHGRSGISRWVWGSVADRIIRHSCVPVLMIRAPGCIPGMK
jgi:nucleotide-binding universal stress UspA family protein